MRRGWIIVALAAAIVTSCAPSLDIPKDAKLLGYGYQVGVRPMQQPGTYYFYDDDESKLVAALYSNDGSLPSVSLRADHRYRIYFAPDQSATRPAGS